MSDPQDQDSSLRQALASQGALVGQHDKILREVTAKLLELSTNVAKLSQDVSQLSTHLTAPSPTPTVQAAASTPPTAMPAREPFIPTPERFSGDLGSCGRFLLQCALVFEQQPHTYASDKSRISFILGLLSGKASQWATAAWEANSRIFQSYTSFTAEMRKIFDHPVKGREAGKRLLSLNQGSTSVSQYAIDFRILAVESGWDDEALQIAYCNGLSDNLKDELAARDETNSLEELISLSIRLDNRLRERRREKSARPYVPRPFQASQSSATPSDQTRSPPVFSSPSKPEPAPEEPMQLGRASLSPAERQRRQSSGLCLYCGQGGHYVRSCSLRPKEKAHQ